MDTALDKLKEKYNDQFITIKLSGFSQGDDKMALREICRQFDVELSKDFNEEEYDGLEKKSMSETLQALLDLLDPQPAPLPENEEGEVPEPSPVAVVIILEEFDRFTQLSRQTLLYNLFDLAQSSRTPLAVIGVTSRMVGFICIFKDDNGLMNFRIQENCLRNEFAVDLVREYLL